MPQLYRADTTRRDEQPLPLHLIGDTHLAISRLLDSKGDHGLFHCFVNTVLEDGFLSTYLSQGKFSAAIVQLLEAVEAVTRVVYYLARLLTLPSMSASLSTPSLFLMLLSSWVILFDTPFL